MARQHGFVLLFLLQSVALELKAAPRRLTRSVDRRSDTEDATFLSASGVPTWAVDDDGWVKLEEAGGQTTREVPGLPEGHAVVVENALSASECSELVAAAEGLGLVDFDVGKNRHAALQVMVPASLESALCQRIAAGLPGMLNGDRFANFLSARLRFYRYSPDGEQEFGAHIDAAFPGSALDDDVLVMDAHDGAFVSRFSALFYLTEDFEGGQTAFFAPETGDQIAAVQPKIGECLLIKQALESEMDSARVSWPSHAGTPLISGSTSKYVIRADCMYAVFDRHADRVRATLAPRSPIFDAGFLRRVEPLYSPHMGVENAASMLYALIRFVKPKKVVEIGAGYTSLWILRALQDNDDELARVRDLQTKGDCKLLDWPWCTDVDDQKSQLQCIDNCAHQTATAGGVSGVAKQLGLDSLLDFVQGDAFEFDFEAESIDLFWLDFGVGDRIADFAGRVFPALKPGGLLVCHSTLTNRATREWLDAVRAGAPQAETGIPPDEVHHLSLLEPHKHFQNSISIFQRRPQKFEEPLYSERA